MPTTAIDRPDYVTAALARMDRFIRRQAGPAAPKRAPR